MQYFISCNKTDFQLTLEFENAKVKYLDLLKNNKFHLHLVNNVMENLLDTVPCNYYDEDSFNRMANDTQSSLSILHCNLQSSFNILKANLFNLKHEFSIIATTETGISKLNILQNLLDDNTFQCKPPTNNLKGGVGIYFHNSCTHSRRSDLDLQTNLPIEDLWYEVNQTYIVGVIRHPNNELELFAQQLENSINIITKENKPFIICGDINIDLIQSDNMKYKSYIDTLLTNNILPTLTLPTRITDHSATIIDHINIFRPLQRLHDIISGNLFLDIIFLDAIISGETTYKCKTSFIREFNEKNLANFK